MKASWPLGVGPNGGGSPDVAPCVELVVPATAMLFAESTATALPVSVKLPVSNVLNTAGPAPVESTLITNASCPFAFPAPVKPSPCAIPVTTGLPSGPTATPLPSSLKVDVPMYVYQLSELRPLDTFARKAS